MIPSKTRESRRMKALKLPKNLERLYKEGKCRECSVVVTRMNFAKILGKFTKVKIQYESNSKPKEKSDSGIISNNTNSRVKRNENGVMQKNVYGGNHAKDLLAQKKTDSATPRQSSNILKENNRLKKPVLKDKNSNYNNTKIKQNSSNVKQYAIIFVDPKTNNNDVKNKINLSDLLPVIDSSILPSEAWCIDYFPKNDEPKDDKVYDRIAAELEDLMYNNKPVEKPEAKPDTTIPKTDEFPSIMDILNDSPIEKADSQTNALEFKPNIESSDVEAMLLDKPNADTEPTPASLDTAPMEVDTDNMSSLIQDVEMNAAEEADTPEKPLVTPVLEEIENPQSPSILDEALQKGIEEHLPSIVPKDDVENEVINNEPQIDPSATKNDVEDEVIKNESKVEGDSTTTLDTEGVTTNDTISEDDKSKSEPSKDNPLISKAGITEVVFKKCKDGKCYKTVTCPKNLKYTINLEGKAVEFLGAPKCISSLEDLQVLLQIVNESELTSLYVMY